ncbi:hypothetical protein JTB14_029876 [Gonioctena quinquepunctata]|nr:hypothetical protein JTB14_029876 [Gonioctena quinquepunctata]
MEKQNRNITSGDIQNAVLGETKQVLEIMVESKKKVSNLQQNLKHIEDIIKQLQIDIGIHKIYALSTTSEKTYGLRKKQYEIEEKNLLNQLQNIEEQISKNKKKCLASKKENQALNEELSNLDREISLYEKQNCEREKNLNEEITLHETEIGLLNEKLALAVEEISTNDQLLAEMSKKKVAREESASESLLTLDKMIQEIQDELTSRNKQMEELINASNDLNNQITGTDCLIKVSETEIVQREMELKDMETKLIMIEQNYSDEINMHQENMSSTEKELTDEKQLNMTLSTELSSYDRRIEELDLEIKNEIAYIDDQKQDQ